MTLLAKARYISDHALRSAMTELDGPWFERWKDARRRHFSSVEKLRDHLRSLGHEKLQISTVNAWEGVGRRNSYPSPAYRPTIRTLNEDFAALIAEMEERERAKAGLSLEGLAAALARLEAAVDLLTGHVEAIETRVDQLEQRLSRRGSRPAREAHDR